METEFGNKAAEGAGIGGAIGGTVGVIAAPIAAVGTTLVLPGLGLVIAGPIAAAVAGAGAGAAGGGLVGALAGWSVPEERVKVYGERLKKRGFLWGSRPKPSTMPSILRGTGRPIRDNTFIAKAYAELRVSDFSDTPIFDDEQSSCLSYQPV